MKFPNIIKSCFKSLIIFLVSYNISFATGTTTNKSFVFNGSTSALKVLDGAPVNGDANQSGFKYFNSTTASSNRKITIDTWVYLIGDNPGVLMPVIKRAVDGGTSFFMYVKDNTAFFSVGNSEPVSTANNFPSFPAFRWIRLTGTYDGQVLKLYYDGVLADTKNVTLSSIYTTGEGLFIGKHGSDSFNGLIDEARIFNIALTSSQISSCSGNGNPSSSIPSSLVPCLVGRWSFTEIGSYSGTAILKDLSSKKNYLRVTDITEVVNSKTLPFFVVNSNGDGADLHPGNGIADAGNGIVTLRSAIQEANALSGSQTIYFYLPGSGQVNISPSSSLPTISGSVFLNGTTQKGYAGSPLVGTNGSFGGLTISAGGSTVQALSLNNSSGYGLTLTSAGGNNIIGNKISGISISSQGNKINGNTITSSTVNGISINAGATNNLIGTLTANTIFGNAGYGISVLNANGNQISNNNVGTNGLGGIFLSNSVGPVIGNSITGNTGFGISINGGTGNQISNNIVGTNIGDGIILSGGTGSLTGNTISSNEGFGLFVNSSTANQISNNAVTANTLGGISLTNSTGNLVENTVTGNLGDGILFNSANGNSITGNTISGNISNSVSGSYGNGISLNSSNTNTFAGNSLLNNSGFGLFSNSSTGNILNNNNIKRDSSGGISIVNSSASITGNTISENIILEYP